ncbi:hypothetical protein RJ640_021851 [Escallonia rubra]|uniref:DSBA-like thioredoxin domain-containing protein n=1 Tax=Escallonia rubra TaxID=112253 RepID=A0AA88USP7_9ASTE|nr:hypothetical protein RJ640_021851 [Escallonia rubra]
MAQAAANDTGKKLIHIDISSDSVCPWCFVGKKNLDKAIASSKDQFDFEGVNKKEFYRSKFGSRSEQIVSRMTEVFRGLGLEYNMSGLTKEISKVSKVFYVKMELISFPICRGSTLDSHRLINFAGQQGLDKQHDLVEELFLGYFTQGKYIGDREFLVESARKVGVEGAAQFLENPENGLKEVNEELEKYSAGITGVPHFKINEKHQLSGGQPPEVFRKAFQVAASDST